ncbi:MAG: class I SAM-dependent methyltransferase [Kofleriaceae bacterium]|nr:class I SAM-dependent methyltransferase [Kofleriaceae bacterium]
MLSGSWFKVAPTIWMQRPQATAFSSLRSRAHDADQADSQLHDAAARALAHRLGVDCVDVDQGRARAYLTRTAALDGWVREAIATSSTTAVVDLGAGLDTRFERVDDGHVHWLDVDLEDVIRLRQRTLPAHARRTHLAGGALDPRWQREARAVAASCCVVMQGLLAYLPADAIQGLFAAIADTFEHATVVLDLPRAWQQRTPTEVGPLWGHGHGFELVDFVSSRLVRLSTKPTG